MDNQNQNPQPAPTVAPVGSTPVTPPVQPVAPAAPASGTAPASAPVVAAPGGKKKNGGLLLVAVILVVLIAVLGVLYYIIMQQSQKPEPTPQIQPTPTSVPNNTLMQEVSPTPSDEEVLNTDLPDPLEDQKTLEKTMEGL